LGSRSGAGKLDYRKTTSAITPFCFVSNPAVTPGATFLEGIKRRRKFDAALVWELDGF
jgi:hypothetical protein